MRTLFALAAVTAATALADDPKPRAERVQGALKELEDAQDRIGAAFKKAADKAEKDKIRKEYAGIVKATGDKLLALAAEKPDDEPAFNALSFVLANGDAAAAAGLLAKHHLGRKQLAAVLPQAAEDPAAADLLRAALDKSPLPEVKGAACTALGVSLAERSGGTGDAKLAAEAEALLDRAAREFADQPWEDGTVKSAVAKLLPDLRERGVGKPAPEFSSTGLDDQPAKLSALKGKVVVLDIWATWCGPCRAMIPHERELVKKLAGKPFALVSVSADSKKEALTEFLKDTPMPWTHWWEGEGPNLKAWNVRYFPTIYVIDAKGVIRYKGVRGKAMDEAVEKLLAEAEAGR